MQVLRVSSNENKSVQSHVIPVTWEHWQFSSTRAVISAGLIAFFFGLSQTIAVKFAQKLLRTYFFDCMQHVLKAILILR